MKTIIKTLTILAILSITEQAIAQIYVPPPAPRPITCIPIPGGGIRCQ